MKLVPSWIERLAHQVACWNARGRRFDLDEVTGPRGNRTLKPVYFDTGVGTHDRAHIFGSLLGMPSPSLWHTYFNDFDSLAEFNGITDTATWDVHATGVNTFALADGDGGLALITNAAADDDNTFFQKKGESFRWESGKPMVFGCRLKINEVVQSDFVAGLVLTDTTPLDVTDGIFFQKDDGDALIDFHVEKNNTATDALALATMVADTFVTLQFAYDPDAAKIWYGVNGVIKGGLALTNVCDDEDLAVTFGVQNGAAAAKTMTIDYIFAAKYMGRV